mgnify:FL=1
MYGLKGMAAYLEHAMRLGHNDESIHRFMQNTIAQIQQNLYRLMN